MESHKLYTYYITLYYTLYAFINYIHTCMCVQFVCMSVCEQEACTPSAMLMQWKILAKVLLDEAKFDRSTTVVRSSEGSHQNPHQAEKNRDWKF